MRSTVFRYNITTPLEGHTLSVSNLPAGTYLLSYDVPMWGSTGEGTTQENAECEVLQELTSPVKDTFHGRATSSTNNAFFNAISATTRISTTDGDFVQLRCFSQSKQWTTPSGEPATLVLTRIDAATAGTATVG